MPVPGSLRRMPIDEGQIAELLSRQFNLPTEETRAYLKLLDTSDLTLEQLAKELNLTQEGTGALVTSMIERGLVQSLRDRRATVDRVVNLLIPVYEERKLDGGKTKD